MDNNMNVPVRISDSVLPVCYSVEKISKEISWIISHPKFPDIYIEAFFLIENYKSSL